MIYITLIILLSLIFFSLTFLISSIFENEKRATTFAVFQTIIFFVSFLLLFYSHSQNLMNSGIGFFILTAMFFITSGLIIILTIPIGANRNALKGTKGLIVGNVKRIDERDILFSKITQEKIRSHSLNPLSIFTEMGKIDGSLGLSNVIMGEKSSEFARNIATSHNLRPPASENIMKISPEEASCRIKGYADSLGAVLTGITELNPLWVYSHYGRSGIVTDNFAGEINNEYKYAIVLVTEMDASMISAAPHTPAILESLQNYAKGAFIATQVASYIANLGYSAKVNQMAHYDTMMVPLAVDAGIGELSRMGYLITYEYGPRVRLSAVLTNLPLITERPVDIGVVDFCSKCKKCAINCPSNSITTDVRTTENGSLRWIIDRESCFSYWQKIGTDCCICMKVCPWSHPRTFPHRLITNLVARNSIARSVFTLMDDMFYGRKPPQVNKVKWAKFR